MDIEQLLVECVAEISELSGYTANVTADSRPLLDIAGFVSHNAVEAICELSARIGVEIEGDVELFVSESGRDALTIRQIAARISAQVNRIVRR